MNSPKREIGNVDGHRASYGKQLRSKKHLENQKMIEMMIPEWLFQEPVENKINKIFDPKSLEQIARDKTNLGDKQLNKKLAKRIINLFFKQIEI